MAMIEINKEPSRRELFWFGLIFALFFGIVGGLVIWKSDSPQVAYWIWAAAGAVTVAYYLVPPLKRPLYLGWMYAVFPLGWALSHLLLGLIYYCLFTPIGAIMRLVGYDPMRRKFDPEAATYWMEREQTKDQKRYFRQL